MFIARGYRATQIADIADEAGVAKGTVYLCVESKDALFALTLLHAGGEIEDVDALPTPVAAPEPGELAKRVSDVIGRHVTPPSLARALETPAPADVRSELAAIVGDLWATASRYRTAIKLIDTCRDHTELAHVLYDDGRFRQVDLLAQYLEQRLATGRLRSVPDVRAAARFVVEAIATWAVHVHWDPAPQALDADHVQRTVLQFLLGGLTEE